MLVKMESMGGRKPGQLLSTVTEFFLASMEETLSFHFMQHLLPTLRRQLGEVEHTDP
jgi:hypothetical protein